MKNIYVRPVLNDGIFSLSVTAYYKAEEIESFHTIDEAFIILAPYMNNPFWLCENNSGRDVMIDLPSIIDESQLKELHIKLNATN